MAATSAAITAERMLRVTRKKRARRANRLRDLLQGMPDARVGQTKITRAETAISLARSS